MNIQENSFHYHRESYIIIKNHKKSWKVIERAFFIFLICCYIYNLGKQNSISAINAVSRVFDDNYKS